MTRTNSTKDITSGPIEDLRTEAGQAGDLCQPVGVVEVAERLGVGRKAVDKWRQRGLGFPEPAWVVGGRPAWRWAEVERWAQDTGRA